jgi:hypothetical protein
MLLMRETSALPAGRRSTGRSGRPQTGFDTEREAWKACREAMRDADRGRIVKPCKSAKKRSMTEALGIQLVVVLADARSEIDNVSRGETIRRALIEYLTK